MLPTPDLTFSPRQDLPESAPVFYTARVTGTSVDNITEINFSDNGTITVLQQRTIEIPQDRARPFAKIIIVPTKLTVSPQVLEGRPLGMDGWVRDLYEEAIARAYRSGQVADTMYVGDVARNSWPKGVSLADIRQHQAQRESIGPKTLSGIMVREQPTIVGDGRGHGHAFDPISVLGIGLIPIISDLCKRGARVLKESFPRVNGMGLGRRGQFVENIPGETFKPAQLRIGTSSYAQQFCSAMGAAQVMTVIAFCDDPKLRLSSGEIAREFAVSQELSQRGCVGLAADSRLFPDLAHCTTVRVRGGMEAAMKMAYAAGMLSENDRSFMQTRMTSYRLDRTRDVRPAAPKTPAPSTAVLAGMGADPQKKSR